jgi:hypothetical protein
MNINFLSSIDQKVKILKNKDIVLVKVQWTCYSAKDATWEHENTMQYEHLHFFANFEVFNPQFNDV